MRSAGDEKTESDRVATEEATDTAEPTDTAEEPEVVEVPDGAVAVVGDEPITRAEFQRFNRQALAIQGGRPGPTTKRAARDQVMKFVISARWLELEAEAREVTVSEDEVDRAFAKQKRQAFPTEADYRRFLKTSGGTEASIRYRVRVDLLSVKLKKALGKGGTSTASPRPSARSTRPGRCAPRTIGWTSAGAPARGNRRQADARALVVDRACFVVDQAELPGGGTMAIWLR